jgi:hypothetical protein
VRWGGHQQLHPRSLSSIICTLRRHFQNGPHAAAAPGTLLTLLQGRVPFAAKQIHITGTQKIAISQLDFSYSTVHIADSCPAAARIR